MEMEEKKCVKCPEIEVDGNISGGRQFDLDIMLPTDDRDFIYGTVKNCHKDPVKYAAVKLVEIVCEDGRKERRPVGHTFTDKNGEFVFGPLCPDRKYAVQIWANATKKIKIFAKSTRDGYCLKGTKHDRVDCIAKTEK